MEPTEQAIILKTDEVGRVRMPADRREQLLDEFERSGLSGARFAALAGIKYQTFATWMRARRKRRVGSESVNGKTVDSVQWLEAVVEAGRISGGKSLEGVTLQLPGGVRMEVVDEKQAALAAVLIKALGKPC